MRRRSDLLAAIRRADTRRFAAGLLGLCLAAVLPAAAQANNLFSVDPGAASAGPIVIDAAGNGYLAWEREAANSSEPDTTIFCKISPGGSCTNPIVLPLPIPGNSNAESVTQAFPVLGSTSGVVYVVAPRYVDGDTLIWTSEDGGAKFSAAKVVADYAEGSGVGDVLRNPLSPTTHPTSDDFTIASFNSAVGITEVGDLDTKPFSLRFAANDDGQGSTLGFTDTSHLPVEAYWNFASPYEVAFDYLKTGSGSEEKDWSTAQFVTKGYEPRLAGGPDGLFLLSTDVASGEEQPSLLDVRKYNEATHSFGAPTTVATIPTGVFSLFTGGEIFENPDSGTLYIAEPVETASDTQVILLWESTDGGQSFHGEREIAAIAGGYEGPPRLAVAGNGQGWLTFKDEGGLEVADLNQQATPTAPITVTPTPTPTPAPAPTPLPTTTTTTQSGAGSVGASITVPQGTAVSDQAHIAGAAATSATGTVTYNLYKDSKCTIAATAGSTASVLAGVAGPSAAVKPGPGTYYWRVAYGGNATNDGSTSACGSEVLVVAVNETHLGLPASNVCLSKRAFLVHPRAPKGVKLVSVEVLINGKLSKKGPLSGHATAVSLVGLPKGTFKVALITKSSKGKTYEEVRTFHTCVAGKHRQKK
jgi:hypothetical protein